MAQGYRESEKKVNGNLKKLHFLEVVDKIQRQKRYHGYSLKDVCIIAAKSEAPQYYLAAKHTLEVYNRFKQTGILPTKSEVEQAKYKEIFTKYEEARKQHPRVYEKFTCMLQVLTNKASSFFLNPDGILDFYYLAMKYRRSLIKKNMLCNTSH